MNIFEKIVGKLKTPLQLIQTDVAEKIAETAAVGARAALNEAPILDALLDGKPVDVTVRIQLKVGE